MSKDGCLTYKQIFEHFGIDLDIIGVKTPKECLKRWNRIYRSRGLSGLSEDTRGRKSTGRIRVKGLSDEDKIKRLELEVLYLKAENDFLAKLRAKRAE
jgi:hypothetical protein